MPDNSLRNKEHYYVRGLRAYRIGTCRFSTRSDLGSVGPGWWLEGLDSKVRRCRGSGLVRRTTTRVMLNWRRNHRDCGVRARASAAYAGRSSKRRNQTCFYSFSRMRNASRLSWDLLENIQRCLAPSRFRTPRFSEVPRPLKRRVARSAHRRLSIRIQVPDVLFGCVSEDAKFPHFCNKGCPVHS
jgi:hypothetical protein